MRGWWKAALASVGSLFMASCSDGGGSSGGSYRVDPSLNRDAANPAAATRQQCIDAGFEPGTIQFTQCITEGRGLPDK